MAKTLLNKFVKSLPNLYKAAIQSNDEDKFLSSIRAYASLKIEENISAESVRCAKTILTIAENENKTIYELSKGEKIFIETFSLLWSFLRESGDYPSNTDIYEDLLNLFLIAEGAKIIKQPSEKKVREWMRRWPSGIEREVADKRDEVKRRLIVQLVKKIEKRGAVGSRYTFSENMTYQEKVKMVEIWWSDFRFHLSMAAWTPGELNHYLEESLPVRVIKNLSKARNKGIPFFVTPYYLSLLNTDESGFDDNTIRSYIIYSEALVETYGNIKAWEKEDIVQAGKPNAAGWILPESHSIHRRYPEVAIMIPETRGRSCGGLCASCQRMYDFQRERLNFELDDLKPKEQWEVRMKKLMNYFRSDSQLRDILITGGDALMTSNKNLRKILEAVLLMAKEKRDDNKNREHGKKYAELQRVRLGSRLLAYLPSRIDQELITILREFRERGSEAGICQFVVQTHFQSPLEVTPEAKNAVKMILSAGWTISNQLVFNAAASRRGHTAKLRQVLNSIGVITYYTFSVKGFAENRTLFSPNSRSIQEATEEKSIGKLSPSQAKELNQLFLSGKNFSKEMKEFMRRDDIPFLPTDRNVLNLPAIGKSMTFEMVGVTKRGERILKFDHDRTRKHSPIIDTMGDVFIAENRSVASYLREIEGMGENKKEYESIWSYTTGETEPVFWLFKYPNKGLGFTDEMTNIAI